MPNYKEIITNTVTNLLALVASGKQKEAEELIKRNPQFLLKKDDVIDLSGRHFKNITAFQYTLWALDRHMWSMILKYLPKNDATNQLKELEANSIEYTLHNIRNRETVKIKQNHYSFENLIGALEGYAEQYKTNNIADKEALQRYWNHKVGQAQLLAPAHVANEYTNTDRGFKPTPEFNEATLPRNLKFTICKYYASPVFTRNSMHNCNEVTGFSKPAMHEYNGSWFNTFKNSKIRFDLGDDYIILRGKYRSAFGVEECTLLDSTIDLAAIKKLKLVRTNEYNILKNQLELSSEKTALAQDSSYGFFQNDEKTLLLEAKKEVTTTETLRNNCSKFSLKSRCTIL